MFDPLEPERVIVQTSPEKYDLVTSAEAAEMLRLGLSTVQRHVTTGALRSIRIGRLVFIPAGEIARVKCEGLATPAPAALGPARRRSAINRARGGEFRAA